MPTNDPWRQFADEYLGGRSVPPDLCKLLQLHVGDKQLLKRFGVRMLDGGRMPALVAMILDGHDNPDAAKRLACAQAMGDMIRYSGFVAETDTGDAIGYWFTADSIPIEEAPLLRFDTNGRFSILPGTMVAEGILLIASQGSNQRFFDLRQCLNEAGLDIPARTIQDLRPGACRSDPETTYQELIRSYSADLSTTAVPDTGQPADIMTMRRGPKIGPEN
jgi:hypothetical protein